MQGSFAAGSELYDGLVRPIRLAGEQHAAEKGGRAALRAPHGQIPGGAQRGRSASSTFPGTWENIP